MTTKKSYNRRSSRSVNEQTPPAPPKTAMDQHQFTCRLPKPIWEKISAMAEERGVAANTVVNQLVAAALASEEELPSAENLLAEAMKGAEKDATQVYGDVPSELENLSESIEKINTQLEKLDEEISKLSTEGNFKALRLRIAEREELRGKLALLQGKKRTLEERARERDKYAAACYRARILRQVDHLEPLIRQRLASLAEVLDVAISLLNELPEFRRWETGLLYYILAHLARESADPNWARLLQGHLPSVGWDKPKGLTEVYAR